MRTVVSCILFCVAAAASAVVGLTAQEIPIDWEPERLQVERAELEELLGRWEAVASSQAYSSGQRSAARRAADRIRERLTQGDFRIGDRISLWVEGEAMIPDTLVVNPGPSLVIENIGTISLAGVLRSELTQHLQQELGAYIRDPRIIAGATIRIQMEGGVGRPGFYTFPSEMLLSESIMQAGGPDGSARLEDIEIRRGEELLMEDEEVSLVLQDGRSLDHLNLRGGDRIIIPQQQSSRYWPMVIRWGAIIVSTTLLGIRIF